MSNWQSCQVKGLELAEEEPNYEYTCEKVVEVAIGSKDDPTRTFFAGKKDIQVTTSERISQSQYSLA